MCDAVGAMQSLEIAAPAESEQTARHNLPSSPRWPVCAAMINRPGWTSALEKDAKTRADFYTNFSRSFTCTVPESNSNFKDNFWSNAYLFADEVITCLKKTARFKDTVSGPKNLVIEMHSSEVCR